MAEHRIVAPRMLVKKLLPYEGIAFIGGQSGSGKTFIAGDLTVSLTSELPFFGCAINERVGVAFIAAEGTEQLGNRLRAAADARGADFSKLPIAWRGDAPPLKNAADVDHFGKQLVELGRYLRAEYGTRLGVAILDTVAATFDMEDEDKNSEVAKAISKMRRLGRTFGGLVVPIHHYGKTAATGLRGGSAWRAGADVVLSVIAERNEITGKVSSRELALAKARDGIEGPISPFTLTFVPLGTDPDGDDFGTCIVEPMDAEAVRSDGGRKLSNRQRLALIALTECAASCGNPVPPELGLPAGLIAVILDQWRNELYRRSIIDRDAKNPRQDFRRVREALQARALIGAHENLAWRA
jgi:hypothetical protein